MSHLAILPDLTTPESRAACPSPAPGHKILQTEDITIGGIPRGMQSGAPSVAILARLPGGDVAFIETSLALFLSTADALRAKYGDPRDTVQVSARPIDDPDTEGAPS